MRNNGRFSSDKRFQWRLIDLFLGLAAIAAVSSLSGCAYHIGSADRAMPGGYREIAVPVFKNLTTEAGVEVYFTNAMIRELERSQLAKVTNKVNSLVTLVGTVDSVSYIGGAPIQGTGFVYAPTVTPQVGTTADTSLPTNTVLFGTYDIVVKSTLRLVRNSDKKELWQGTFRKETTYQTPKIGIVGLTSADALYNQSARYQNIEQMAADMMAEAEDRLTENF